MPKAAMPHCDQRVLHAPGKCHFCDLYPDLQDARKMWGIAFTGKPPTEEQPLPCPSEVRRDLETINRWPGNRPSPAVPIIPEFPTAPEPGTVTTTSESVEDWWSAHSPTQLGRPNIPVLRRDLEVMIREIVHDVLRQERDAKHH